jgi:hypothetical protein
MLLAFGRHDFGEVGRAEFIFLEDGPSELRTTSKHAFVACRRRRPALAIHYAIVRPYHLSYPFLLRQDSEVLCIPAHESGRWQPMQHGICLTAGTKSTCSLKTFRGVDPTIFQHDGVGGCWLPMHVPAGIGIAPLVCRRAFRATGVRTPAIRSKGPRRDMACRSLVRHRRPPLPARLIINEILSCRCSGSPNEPSAPSNSIPAVPSHTWVHAANACR